jgi:hypothetical protein
MEAGMNDVMLPWPEPRRPRKDKVEQAQPAQAAPHFEIQRVNADAGDDSDERVEILPVTRPPWAAKAGRIGFLGAGVASSMAAAMLLSACSSEDDSEPPFSPSPSEYDSGTPTPTDSWPTYPTPTETDPSSPWPSPPTDIPTYPTETAPTDSYPDPGTPTYGTTGGSVTGGSGGTVCTCNKVCTCIPVCQAHELLNPDPVVRRMAETVVVAMGTRELPYMRWAAREASAPLRTRIEELIGELRDGRGLTDEDLADPGCEPYLDSGDPVIAMMAAQHLGLRATRGAGLSGAAAERAAAALTAGHALHRERAPAWSGEMVAAN